jgi:hypothetical protein
MQTTLQTLRTFLLACRPARATIALGLLLMLGFAQSGLAQAPLNFGNNYFVTGDYVVAGVGLRGLGVNGFATQQFKMPDANSVPSTGVPSGADIVAALLYWGTVESSRTTFAGQNEFFRPVFSGGPATGYPTIAGAHDISRFQVAVNNAHTVGCSQAANRLLHDVHRLGRWQLSLAMQQVAQVIPFDELHGDELHAFGVAQVVNTDDIAIGNLTGEKDLLLEALQNVGITGQFGTDHFQRDRAAQFAVFGLVNGPHAAFADRLENLVASAQHRSRKQGGKLPDRTGGGSGWRWAAPLASVEQGWRIRAEAAGWRAWGAPATIVGASDAPGLPLPPSTRVGLSDESGDGGADSSFAFPCGTRVGLSESDVFGTLGSLIPYWKPGKRRRRLESIKPAS